MEIISIVKIKDGLFLGNKMTSTTLEVITQFKISNIINASGKQIHNEFQHIGVKYLTFNWVENPSSSLNFIKDDTAKKILYFIDDAFKKEEAVLITSVRGQNRAGAVALIYLMKKYSWSLRKALKYFCTKKAYFSLNKSYMNQLTVLEGIISKQVKLSNENDWLSCINSKDELLLCNTYLNETVIPKKKMKNSKNNKSDTNNNSNNSSNKLKRVGWIDRKNKTPLIVFNIDRDLYINKNIKDINNHLVMKPLKSIIKKKPVPLKKSSNIKFFLAAKKPNENDNNINDNENNINENDNFQDNVINDLFKMDVSEEIFPDGKRKRKLTIDDLSSSTTKEQEKEKEINNIIINSKQSNLFNTNSEKQLNSKMYIKNKDKMNIINNVDVQFNNFFNNSNNNSNHKRLNSATKKQEQEKSSMPNIINFNSNFKNHQNKIFLRSLINTASKNSNKDINFNFNNPYNNILIMNNNNNNQNRNKKSDSFDKNNKIPSFDLTKKNNQSSNIYNNRYEQNNVGPVKLFNSDEFKKFKSAEKNKKLKYKYEYSKNLSTSSQIHKNNSMHKWKKPPSAQQRVGSFKSKIIKKMNGNILSKSNGFSYKQMSAPFFPNIGKDSILSFGIGDSVKNSFETYRIGSSTNGNNRNRSMSFKKKKI